jgi:hypothetical protein
MAVPVMMVAAVAPVVTVIVAAVIPAVMTATVMMPVPAMPVAIMLVLVMVLLVAMLLVAPILGIGLGRKAQSNGTGDEGGDDGASHGVLTFVTRPHGVAALLPCSQRGGRSGQVGVTTMEKQRPDPVVRGSTDTRLRLHEIAWSRHES